MLRVQRHSPYHYSAVDENNRVQGQLQLGFDQRWNLETHNLTVLRLLIKFAQQQGWKYRYPSGFRPYLGQS